LGEDAAERFLDERRTVVQRNDRADDQVPSIEPGAFRRIKETVQIVQVGEAPVDPGRIGFLGRQRPARLGQNVGREARRRVRAVSKKTLE
jgi:hypothetical protein